MFWFAMSLLVIAAILDEIRDGRPELDSVLEAWRDYEVLLSDSDKMMWRSVSHAAGRSLIGHRLVNVVLEDEDEGETQTGEEDRTRSVG